jgi:hypothetical protein
MATVILCVPGMLPNPPPIDGGAILHAVSLVHSAASSE